MVLHVVTSVCNLKVCCCFFDYDSMLIKLSCCDVRVYHSSSICSVYFDMFDLTNLHGSLCRPISEFKVCTQKERKASIQLEAVFKD